MLIENKSPWWNSLHDDYIFQHDGAPPHDPQSFQSVIAKQEAK